MKATINKLKCFFVALVAASQILLGCAGAPVKEGSVDAAQLSAAESTDQKEPENDASQNLSLFLEGYEAFSDQDYRDAAVYFYDYMQTASVDVEEYEWAQFFLGVSLMKTGYSHAAVDILADLVVRKPNTRIVAYSLEMFEDISRKQPFDRDLLIHQVVCDQAYGFVEGHLADFIQYYQGIYDWENGFYEWGDAHFRNIDRESYYHYKAMYQKALLHVHRDQIDAAVGVMEGILSGNCQDKVLLDVVRKTMARLLYEKGDFPRADRLYLEIEEDILKQSQNLLERAWAHYRLGNAERAMGLLYAFEAPSFSAHFTPEYYILKSFIYKDVCHYQRAMEVVQDFRERYGDSLEAIYKRREIREDDTLLLLLLNKEKINEIWRFIELLEKEKSQLVSFEGETIQDFLGRLYDLQIAESSDVLNKQVSEKYEEYANNMLKYEEEAHLMAYEIGLDMYQRVHQYHYASNEKHSEKDDGKVVVYPFQGEFWNDELADYKVVLPNKCNKPDEWDIYFK